MVDSLLIVKGMLSVFKFCPRCGTKLVPHEIANQQRLICPHCHYVHWSDETISVGGIVTKEDKILLVQRAQHPGRGLWTNPGGYVEQTENLSDGITREIKEETGLLTKARGIALVADKPDGKDHNLFVNFRLDYLSGKFHIQTSELLNAGFFTLAEIQQMPVADLTKEIIDLVIRDDNSKASLSKTNVPVNKANGFILYK